jgi:hypothetical protein
MGYITSAVTSMDLCVATRASIVLNGAPATVNLFSLAIPAGIQPKDILFASVEFIADRIQNTAVGANFVSAGAIQISDDGGTTYHNALAMVNLMNCGATEIRQMSSYRGDTDVSDFVKSCVNAEVDVFFQWLNATANAANLNINDYTVVLHLYLA